MIDARTRRMIERRIMICLAGAETQAAWHRRQPGAPDDWEERGSAGVQTDSEAWPPPLSGGGAPHQGR